GWLGSRDGTADRHADAAYRYSLCAGEAAGARPGPARPDIDIREKEQKFAFCHVSVRQLCQTRIKGIFPGLKFGWRSTMLENLYVLFADPHWHMLAAFLEELPAGLIEDQI